MAAQPGCVQRGASAMHVHCDARKTVPAPASWDPDVAEAVVDAIREACRA